jgi:hypothetical protein
VPQPRRFVPESGVARRGTLAETLSRAYAASAIDTLSMFRNDIERRVLSEPPPSAPRAVFDGFPTGVPIYCPRAPLAL